MDRRLSEVLASSVDGQVQGDISKWELDTPALCVDLDAMERNISVAQGVTARNGIATRPHTKTHKCPPIAKLQMTHGAIGICTAKVSEAEVMCQHGLEQILQTTTNVTSAKVERAMQLRAQSSGFIQATDTQTNARQLSEAAQAIGVDADVVIDVDPGVHRTGIAPGEPALALAQLVDQLPGLTLKGLLCYDGESQHVRGFEQRRRQALQRLEAAAETFELFQRSGLSTEIFSGGGTGTYNIQHETRGLTDVQIGSYIFMDAQYIGIGGESDRDTYTDFEPSLTTLTTVLHDQCVRQVSTDAGAKACTINRPWPIVKGETGLSYTATSDEFGVLSFGDDASRSYKVGDKLELIVSHCDPVVNLYDYIFATRNDRVVNVWPIAGRGMSA